MATSVSQCTYRCVVLPDCITRQRSSSERGRSQCTYRCVVFPDDIVGLVVAATWIVSMHLQVRGAP